MYIILHCRQLFNIFLFACNSKYICIITIMCCHEDARIHLRAVAHLMVLYSLNFFHLLALSRDITQEIFEEKHFSLTVSKFSHIVIFIFKVMVLGIFKWELYYTKSCYFVKMPEQRLDVEHLFIYLSLKTKYSQLRLMEIVLLLFNHKPKNWTH